MFTCVWFHFVHQRWKDVLKRPTIKQYMGMLKKYNKWFRQVSALHSVSAGAPDPLPCISLSLYSLLPLTLYIVRHNLYSYGIYRQINTNHGTHRHVDTSTLYTALLLRTSKVASICLNSNLTSVFVCIWTCLGSSGSRLRCGSFHRDV
jgi:hypothetical protein